MESTGDERRLDRHSALAATPWGRAGIVIVVLVGAIWLVGPNIPRGPLQDDLDALWKPATEIGLQQDWGVFSPNPRSQSLDVEARILHEDGSIEVWGVPDFDPVIGSYRQYRWNKWQERVRLDNRRQHWEPTAEWLADRFARDGVRPLTVTLVRRWIDHEPLGSPEPIDSEWNEFEFFVWERDA